MFIQISSIYIVVLVQVFRQILQHIMQKQISKNLASTSRLARAYQSLLQSNHSHGNGDGRGGVGRTDEDRLVDFIRFGDKLNVLPLLDGLLQHALTELAPVYREFALRSSEGSLLRAVDDGALSAYAMDAAAVSIQCLARRRRAKSTAQQRRGASEQERQLQRHRQLGEEEVRIQKQQLRHRRQG